MVVADKAAIINAADKLSAEILDLICKHGKDLKTEENDPAEQAYFIAHAMGILLFKMCYSMEEYSKIYGIKGMTMKTTKEWIDMIYKENAGLNKPVEKL
jgi:transcriptional regulator of aromatic amino acid metabolism